VAERDDVRSRVEAVEAGLVAALEAGDLVFTGTPAGVGSVRDPRRYLVAGDVIRSAIEGLGTMENRCITRE
jgi:2-keto-4-pentenoate hydratase/2-oxohepta-3-ene-1,7-dioic acid hydratase in catechol pathway